MPPGCDTKSCYKELQNQLERLPLYLRQGLLIQDIKDILAGNEIQLFLGGDIELAESFIAEIKLFHAGKKTTEILYTHLAEINTHIKSIKSASISALQFKGCHIIHASK
jgi:hypothetical protein